MAKECFSQCEQPSESTCSQQAGTPKLLGLCLPGHLAPTLSSWWALFIYLFIYSLFECKMRFVIFACTATALYPWKDLFQRLKGFSLTHCCPNISHIKNTLLFHMCGYQILFSCLCLPLLCPSASLSQTSCQNPGSCSPISF